VMVGCAPLLMLCGATSQPSAQTTLIHESATLAVPQPPNQHHANDQQYQGLS